MTEAVATPLAQYGDLIFTVLGFILTVIVGIAIWEWRSIRKVVHGDGDNQGLVSDVNVLKERQDDSDERIDKIESKVDNMQSQIVENQKTLTKELSAFKSETSEKLGKIIGYLEAKSKDEG